MAIANLPGGNLFNILVLAVGDVLYTQGTLLANVSSIHSISAFSAVMMTGWRSSGSFIDLSVG